jgi:hypothetical protein
MIVIVDYYDDNDEDENCNKLKTDYVQLITNISSLKLNTAIGRYRQVVQNTSHFFRPSIVAVKLRR